MTPAESGGCFFFKRWFNCIIDAKRVLKFGNNVQPNWRFSRCLSIGTLCASVPLKHPIQRENNAKKNLIHAEERIGRHSR